jgi:hypothetical protein
VTPNQFESGAPLAAEADSTHSDMAGVDKLRRDSFVVLERALREFLREEGRPPTASELRLRMGALTHGGFKLSALRYRRFRDLLADAEAQDLVVVNSARQGDVAVDFPGLVAGDQRAGYMRPDLWKALVDWNPRMTRVWDLEVGRALVLPSEPVLLEPERFARIRALIASEPHRFVSIPHLTVVDQLQMLKGLAAKFHLDLGTRAALDGAFNSDRPMKAALDVLRGYDVDFATSWTNVLRAEALKRAETWKAGMPALADVDLFPASAVPREKEILNPPASSRADASQVPSSVLREDARGHVPRTYVTEAALRSLIHAAIDRMSPRELRALVIPVGYLLPEK